MRPVLINRCLALVILLVLLSACGGTLEVSLLETPEPGLDPLAPEATLAEAPTPEATDETAGPISLDSYTSPRFGYRLPVPAEAESLEDENGRLAYFGISQGTPGEFSFLLAVEVLLELPEGASTSAQALLESFVADEAVLTPLTLDSPFEAAAASIPGGEAPICPETRVVLAAFLADGVGYVLRLASDGPERCDAAALPETAAILEGFEPPAIRPVMEMTPTPTPEPLADLLVAYVKQGNLYLWGEAAGERQLTTAGAVEQPLISPDGELIAFRREGDIWVVNADGSDERLLVAGGDLTLPDLGELNSAIIGISPYQLAWLSGTHRLLFNTSPQLEGPGLILSDDLWAVDADTGALESLFPAGMGGNFVLSPDGRQVALVKPSSIHVAEVDGSNRQERFAYTPVVTYSEFQYYAKPVWAPDGQSLAVIIPPADPLGSDSQVYGLWRLTMDGTPARLVGSIEARVTNWSVEPVIAPDHRRVAYVSVLEPGSSRTGLLFVTLGDALGEPFLYTSRVDNFAAWSPDGERFVYAPAERELPGLVLGRLGSEPQSIGLANEAAFNLRWLDGSRFLYLQANDEGWDLVLGDVAGGARVLTSVAGQPPAFDVRYE